MPSLKLNPKLVKIYKPVYLASGILGIFIVLGSSWGIFKVFEMVQDQSGEVFMFIFPGMGLFLGSMSSYLSFSFWKMKPEDISIETDNKN